MTKKCFMEETERVCGEIDRVREHADMIFALVTDSHLSDNTPQTCDNIRRMDERVGYRCLVHMGDLLCGNIPEGVSRKILREDIATFRSTVRSRELYIVQGNHDGYRDESYLGQTVTDIVLDEKWYEDTSFMDENVHLNRPGQKPYYYVDFPDKRVRFIVLCSSGYEHDPGKRIFRKNFGFSKEQLEWLGAEALVTGEDDWNIMLFSHCAPLTEFYSGMEIEGVYYPPDPITEGGGGDAVRLVKACKESAAVQIGDMLFDFTERHTNILCWCAGDIHGDFLCQREGISFLALTSQTAYVPQLWTVPFGEFPGPRISGEVSEDAWDSVAICLQERKVYFYRFGAGKNRVVSY